MRWKYKSKLYVQENNNFMAVLHIEIWEQTLTKDTHIQNIKSVYELQKYKTLQIKPNWQYNEVVEQILGEQEI